MSSGMYDQGVKAIMGGDVDLTNAPVTAMLVSTDFYAPNLSSHASLEDIPEDAIIVELPLTGKTLDVTTFRADDAVFNSVTSDKTVQAVVIFKDADTAANTILIAFLDNAPEFPITPDGSDITVVWDTGANGLFKL